MTSDFSMTYQASERMSLDQTLRAVEPARAHLEKIFARLGQVVEIPEGGRFLDVGAGTGAVMLAAGQLGFKAVGIEPFDDARRVARQAADKLGLAVQIRPGYGEALELPDAEFDIVHAASLLEHVQDPAKTLREIYRVLRPGGILWCCTNNKLCPRQDEIAVLPCFSWYPQGLKLQLLAWAQRHRPAWIGYTDTPAINWFSPNQLKLLLRDAGFSRVYDRWDIRLPSEGPAVHAKILRLIQKYRPVRLMADVLVKAGSYAAVR